MVLLSAGAALALLAAAAALLREALPEAIDPRLSPEASDRPRIVGQPTILALQVVAMALYVVAAIGFTRAALLTKDELMAWFALASTLGAFARLNYFLFPSLYSQWVYTGDVSRLAFFLVLLLGALREIQSDPAELIEAAELHVRRRVARALHDGLAHELTFIATETRRLSAAPTSGPELRHVVAAAERALDESRDAIAALSRRAGDETLGTAVAQAAHEVAARSGIELRLDVVDGGDAGPETREALTRIVREAVTNAARHGAASVVSVELRRDHVLWLRILDDGGGLDPAAARLGFGLTNMRERAEEAGGALHDRQVAPAERRGGPRRRSRGARTRRGSRPASSRS